MRLFEDIIDGIGNEQSQERSSSEIVSDDKEESLFPDFNNFRLIGNFGSGQYDYENMIADTRLMTKAYDKMNYILNSFPSIISEHSKIIFFCHIQDVKNFKKKHTRPDFVKIVDVEYSKKLGYMSLGFVVGIDFCGRTERDAVMISYLLDAAASIYNPGSFEFMSGSKDNKVFIDYDNICWLAELYNIHGIQTRPHNMFYDEKSLKNNAKRLFNLLTNSNK